MPNAERAPRRVMSAVGRKVRRLNQVAASFADLYVVRCIVSIVGLAWLAWLIWVYRRS